MNDVRYEVTRERGHFRRDWLNVLLARFPYTVRVYKGDDVYPRCRHVGVAATFREARRLIKTDQAAETRLIEPRSAVETTVYVERHGADSRASMSS